MNVISWTICGKANFSGMAINAQRDLSIEVSSLVKEIGDTYENHPSINILEAIGNEGGFNV